MHGAGGLPPSHNVHTPPAASKAELPPALRACPQVLLSLPGFVGDLQRAQETLGTALPADGVAAALLECVAAKASRWVGAWLPKSTANDLLWGPACQPCMHVQNAALRVVECSLRPSPNSPFVWTLKWALTIMLPPFLCRGSQGFFAPVSLKKAMGARLAAFQGAFQQVGSGQGWSSTGSSATRSRVAAERPLG